MPIRLDGGRDDAQRPAAHLERAAELDLHLLVRPGDLPRVGPAQPVVRLLALPAVLDRLPEDAVLVAQPVAHGRQLHRGHRVEEARREAPRPPLPSPASGSSSSRPSQSRRLSRRLLATGSSSRFVMLLASDAPMRNSIER
jgi:hypothetical protein